MKDGYQRGEFDLAKHARTRTPIISVVPKHDSIGALRILVRRLLNLLSRESYDGLD